MVKSGDRRQRLSKRERIKRDSTIKEVRPVYITGLSSRIASRVVGKVLKKENLARIEEEALARVQTTLEKEVEGLIVMKMRDDVVHIPPEHDLDDQEISENEASAEKAAEIEKQPSEQE